MKKYLIFLFILLISFGGFASNPSQIQTNIITQKLQTKDDIQQSFLSSSALAEHTKQLNWRQKLTLKLIEKKIIKKGSLNEKKPFSIVGFLFGFLLGLIGVLIAYLINKKDYLPSAWYGLLAVVVFMLLVTVMR